MRLYPLTTARAAPYDRNVTTKAFASNLTLQAPHADTQRWTYTVPAGKKFQIGSAQVSTYRTTVAGVSGQVAGYIAITPSGGAVTVALPVIFLNNTLNFGSNIVGLTSEYLFAGDQIQGRDQDASTGGACDFNENVTGYEFDA